MTSELQARSEIDRLLTASGRAVQDVKSLDLGTGRRIAVREFPLKRWHGTADYLLYVDRKVVGVVEAKKEGETLTGVEVQTEKSGAGLPTSLLPLAEQTRIVAKIERRLRVVERVGDAMTTNLRRATCLRQSVSRGAFSGGTPQL